MASALVPLVRLVGASVVRGRARPGAQAAVLVPMDALALTPPLRALARALDGGLGLSAGEGLLLEAAATNTALRAHVGGLEVRPAEHERRVVGFFDRALARD